MTPITSLQSRPILSQVVIDCTDVFAASSERNAGQEVEKLLDWVRSYPRRGEIHVYLQNSLKHRPVRRLQTTLLSYGCTVTTKSAT